MRSLKRLLGIDQMVINHREYSYVRAGAQGLSHRASTMYIVVHHAAAVYVPGGALQAIFNYHSTQWPKYGRIGYHAVLQEEKDGSISLNYVNPSWAVGAHIYGLNNVAYGLCAATNFRDQFPPKKWFEALTEALRVIVPMYPQAQIVGHGEIALKGHGTSCPGTKWKEWKNTLIYNIHAQVPSEVPTYVIGVKPSCTLAQFKDVLKRRGAPFGAYFDAISERIYTVCVWLEIDPAFIVALWLHEQGTPLGGSGIGLKTRNPLNIKAYGAAWPYVAIKGVRWNLYSDWQQGWLHALVHLKEKYGANHLLTVERIIPVFAPEGDGGNKPDSYIKFVKRTMADISKIKV